MSKKGNNSNPSTRTTALAAYNTLIIAGQLVNFPSNNKALTDFPILKGLSFVLIFISLAAAIACIWFAFKISRSSAKPEQIQAQDQTLEKGAPVKLNPLAKALIAMFCAQICALILLIGIRFLALII